MIDKFEISRSQDLGSDDLIQVVKAASENRIIPGKLNDPGFDNILDDLAQMVIRGKGKVVILPKERMPSDTGIAASYRF